MGRRLWLLVGTVAIALALVPAGSAAAPAKGPKSCPAGAFCLWPGKQYKGERFKVTTVGQITNLPSSINNKVSSAKNRWELTSFVYAGKNAEGDFFCVESDDNIPDFSAFVDPFNNVASSAFLPKKPPGACL